MRPIHFYRAALICGLAPLAIGTAVFLLWLAIGGAALVFAGLLTIGCGLVSVIVGAVCLAVYAIWSSGTKTTSIKSEITIGPQGDQREPGDKAFDQHHRPVQERETEKIVRRVAIGAAALLVNFPVAIFFSLTALYMARPPSDVTVINHGPALQQFALSGCSGHVDFGPIATGATLICPFHVRHAGDLEFHATSGDDKVSGFVPVSYTHLSMRTSTGFLGNLTRNMCF